MLRYIKFESSLDRLSQYFCTSNNYFFPKKKILAVIYNGLVEYNLFDEVINTVNDVATNNGIHGTLADVSKLRGSFHRL